MTCFAYACTRWDSLGGWPLKTMRGLGLRLAVFGLVVIGICSGMSNVEFRRTAGRAEVSWMLDSGRYAQPKVAWLGLKG